MVRVSFFLQRHPKSGIIYFRRAIPKRHRLSFNGKLEVKKSLQTYDKNIATIKAMQLNASLESRFNQLDEVNMGNDSLGKITMDGITADFGGDMEKELTAIKKAQEIRNSTPARPQATPTVKQGFASKRLVDVCKEFRAEKMLDEEWSQQTAEGHESSHNLLIQYFGNSEVSTITRGDARKFREVLLQLPSNAAKGVYAGKTIKQILAMKPEKTLARITVNSGYLQRYSSIFEWAAKQDYCASNPFEGLKLSVKRNPIADRNPFTTQELQKIFNPNIYHIEALKAHWKFWVPIIALYTGARLQEVSQLRPCDIFQEKDVYAIDITKATGPLKNVSSERKVPLHPKLIELGLCQR